jgi:flagellar biosynthesis/type III secretory pathway chaperone
MMKATDMSQITFDDIPSSKVGLKILIAELSLQKRHLHVIQDQNAALIACDRRRFVLLHEEYMRLTGELEIQNKLRLGAFGTRKLNLVIAEWPEADRRNASRIISDLQTIVADVRRINVQNRKLVGNEVRYIDFMLNILINTFRKGSTYGPRGSQSINRGNMFFNSAV